MVSALPFVPCGSNESTEKPSAVSSDTAAKDSSPATTDAAGSRDNTPVVLTGSADGTVTYGNDSVTVDASHMEEGYLMVSYLGSNSKVKLQITGSDEITYTYNLHDGYETFPSLPEAVPTPSAYLKILREPVIPPFLRRQLM